MMDMNMIDSPGEAMRYSMRLLRHAGFGVYDAAADWVPDSDRKVITVQGRLTDLETGDYMGTFRGTATTDGRVTLQGGAFGRIEARPGETVEADAFDGL